MEKKYWVPALEKANDILQEISGQPAALKLIDLSKRLDIHKSSMFSLLATMESLEWVQREEDGTYSLGARLGLIGNAFFKQYSLIDLFRKEAAVSKTKLGETIQLAKLEQREVLYLAKEEVPSPVRLASEPGKKFPAHATALGKALLSALPESEFHALFSEEALEPQMTPYTIRTRSELHSQLAEIRSVRYAFDLQEAVVGFCCVAAPVFDSRGIAIAAISCSMFQHVWEEKKELAIREIGSLARRLSHGSLS
ncbi:IclR family transcriptional regulator [Paenibacillus thalictri]|uniref:IclR family transcriptional regulator n=1 Tax=Paenibacillus thalictri TaxID=2527873 RepID=A0A4Q9DNJ9_9BACL|nr:IclR family transcriptional regulator [Paenibacillus thalictri]TBL75115.1 IclR family transcriptional regulator [Paenibacillus thalictri]